MSSQDEMTAFVDESVRISAVPPTYLMAATIPMAGGESEAFEELIQKGARKLHWRDMPSALRKKSVHAIAEMKHITTIVAAAPLKSNKQERARAKCLEALLPALEGLGVSMAVLESRNDRKADLRDIETAEHLRRLGAITVIRIEHAGIEEHGLWLPDQILGAYAAALCETAEASLWKNDWEKALPSIDVIKVEL